MKPKTIRPGIHVEIPETKLGRVLIRTALPADHAYVVARHYRWRKRVGWLTAPGFASAIDRRLVWLAELNGEPCGYLLASGGIAAPLTLRHNTVEHELWRNGLGTEFVSAFVRYARSLGKHKIARVRTRNDITDQLAINLCTGGQLVEVDPKIGSTGRPVTVWHWPLNAVALELKDADVSPLIVAGESSTLPRCGLHPHQIMRHQAANRPALITTE